MAKGNGRQAERCRDKGLDWLLELAFYTRNEVDVS